MGSSYGCQFSNQMRRQPGNWDESRTASQTMVLGAHNASLALPAQSNSMREMMIVARETAMVLMLQIAFRAMLLLRRWNY